MKTDLDELFDVVDEQDRVVGQERREVVHRDMLFHRAVHVWMFDDEGRLLLQLRSEQKDQYPSTWTSSASGHLDAGESYDHAAARELREELGVDLPIREALRLPGSPQTLYEFTRLYLTEFSGDLFPAGDEISEVRWWAVEELQQATLNEPSDFSPPLLSLIQAFDFNAERA